MRDAMLTSQYEACQVHNELYIYNNNNNKKKGDHSSRNEACPLTCICLTAAHIHGTISLFHTFIPPPLQ
jgi:hypothetical protein